MAILISVDRQKVWGFGLLCGPIPSADRRHERQATSVKQDRRSESCPVEEPAGHRLNLLDPRIRRLRARVRHPKDDRVDDAPQISSNHSLAPDHRLHTVVWGAFPSFRPEWFEPPTKRWGGPYPSRILSSSNTSIWPRTGPLVSARKSSSPFDRARIPTT